MKITNSRKVFTLTKTKRTESAFTLIEMLVVISIIGILAALSTISFTSSQKQARDTQRKSDLKMYQNALEVKANTNGGLYPPTESIANLCIDLDMGNCVDDPKYDPDLANGYSYTSNGTAEFTGTKYVLWANLENSTNNWVVCSSGAVGETSTNPGGAGACPLEITP